jgi:hypothetical protein
MIQIMRPVGKDEPVMIAWNRYTGTDDFPNTRRWALHEQHVEGSLWAAFSAGFHAALAAQAFLPMEQWDRRDETVLLLIDYREEGEHPLDDEFFAITIGHNNDHNVGDDEGSGWEFAGWCWTHDHYVQGKGKPVGWMPIPHHLAQTLATLSLSGEAGGPE